MQYQKLSYPAKNYASELFEEYRNRLKENIPDEKASVINFKKPSIMISEQLQQSIC